jgi:hypothetical protein
MPSLIPDDAQSAQVRAKTIEECASHLEQQADLLTNSLHCGDNSATIAAAHKKSRQLYEAATIINELAFAAQPPAAPVADGSIREGDVLSYTMDDGIGKVTAHVRPHNGSSAGSELAERLRRHVDSDHQRGCQGRQYSCACGYDKTTEELLALASAEVARLSAVPQAPSKSVKVCYVKRWRTLVELPEKYADEIVQALREPQTAAQPVAWRYQGRVGWGDVWRLSEVDPTQHEGFFESPEGWIVEPLYPLSRPESGAAE